jgi:hypothetical protein
MNCPHCDEAPSFAASSRRSLDIAGWLSSGLILAVLPKCPACVAAYVMLATGIGMSLTAASYVRLGIMAVSIGMLIALAIRLVCRATTHRPLI